MTVYNLTNEGNNRENDYTTTYTLAADKTFKMEISSNVSVIVDIKWASLDAADATAILKLSTDGTSTQNDPDASTITMSGTNGNNSWMSNTWRPKWLHVALTKNSVTSGTVRILVTMKPN